MIKFSLACTKEGGIGYKNGIPWNLKEELALFKSNTINSTVVMGRKTFESIGSKPLINRMNIILTKKYKKYTSSKYLLFTDNIDYIKKTAIKNDIFVIGGSEIFKLFEKDVKEIYISFIKDKYDCDTFIDLKILNNFKITLKKEYNNFNFYIYRGLDV